MGQVWTLMLWGISCIRPLPLLALFLLPGFPAALHCIQIYNTLIQQIYIRYLYAKHI